MLIIITITTLLYISSVFMVSSITSISIVFKLLKARFRDVPDSNGCEIALSRSIQPFELRLVKDVIRAQFRGLHPKPDGILHWKPQQTNKYKQINANKQKHVNTNLTMETGCSGVCGCPRAWVSALTL